jgi:hypothetical protein
MQQGLWCVIDEDVEYDTILMRPERRDQAPDKVVCSGATKVMDVACNFSGCYLIWQGRIWRAWTQQRRLMRSPDPGQSCRQTPGHRRNGAQTQ